jgi:hypothetical protein
MPSDTGTRLAPAAGGGYVVGRADLVERVGARLAAPGIGTDAGQVSGETLRIMFQVSGGWQRGSWRRLGGCCSCHAVSSLPCQQRCCVGVASSSGQLRR